MGKGKREDLIYSPGSTRINLITLDYLFIYWEDERLSDLISEEVNKRLKVHFAKYNHFSPTHLLLIMNHSTEEFHLLRKGISRISHPHLAIVKK